MNETDIALLIRQARFWFAELELASNTQNQVNVRYASRCVGILVDEIRERLAGDDEPSAG
jgi:hypothetical protein